MRYLHRFVAIALLASAATLHANPAGESIYQLDAALTDQAGKSLKLDRYAGHAVLISMFYADCPNACPLLLETVRSTEAALPASTRLDLRVLLISLDSENDTPASLNALAAQRHVDLQRWTLARADAVTIRKIAAVLHIQYRQLPDGNFNHSSVITLLDKQGAIAQQTSLLGKADPELVARMRTVTGR
jgi:protein SCO1/2